MTIDEQNEEYDLSDNNMTYVKINLETSRKFTAQVKIKINHNTTLEQYANIIKIKLIKTTMYGEDNQPKIFKYYR